MINRVNISRLSTVNLTNSQMREKQIQEDMKIQRSKSLEELYQNIVETKENIGTLSAKHFSSFFFMVKVLQHQRKGAGTDTNSKKFKQLENSAIQCLLDSFGDLKMVRSVMVDNMLQPLIFIKINNPLIMKALKDLLLYNTVYDNARDIKDTLSILAELDEYFGPEIWRSFVDNIIVSQIPNWNCVQLIEIISVYRQNKRTYMIRDLIYQYKYLIVEDIDTIPVKELILLIQVYRYDLQFKSFIGNKLREKIIKNPNLNTRELMTTLSETLDLPDLRREIIKYSLNSELFYAFPISYLITLLNAINKIEYHVDFYDLLKTIQIQLCLLEKQLNILSLEKLCRIHQVLPVLNPHFLSMLLRLHNLSQNNRRIDNRIFNLNISLISLPSITNQQLIDEYELALINELNINKPEQFNVGNLIKFLSENHQFAKHGFFMGFNDMLFQAIQCDERANIDIWFMSVLLKILNLGCTDKEFMYKIEKIIERNFERLAQNTLLKFTTLVLQICPDNARYRELLHKRVKQIRPEAINDQKVSISFITQAAKLDTGINQLFHKFFNYNLKYINQLTASDITKMLQSIYIMKQTENPEYSKFYEKIFEKIQSFEKVQTYELIMNIENLTGYFLYLPQQQKDKQLAVYSKFFNKILNYLQDPSKRVIMLYKKYGRVLTQIIDNFDNLPKDDQLLTLKPIAKECLSIVENHIRIDMESRESSTDSEEDEMQQRSQQQQSKSGKKQSGQKQQQYRDQQNI